MREVKFLILSIDWSLARVTIKTVKEGELAKNPSGRMNMKATVELIGLLIPGKGRHNGLGVGRMDAGAMSRECGELLSGLIPLIIGVLHIITDHA
jgi:hypothetical protein